MPSKRHALSRSAATPRLMLAVSMATLVALTGCAS